MITQQLLQLWFSQLPNNLHGFVQGGIIQIDENQPDSFQCLCASHNFELDELMQQAAGSVIKRRKSVVQKKTSAQVGALSNVARAGQTTTASASVSDIASHDYLVCSPILNDRQLIGVICIVVNKQRTGQTQDILGELDSALQWLYSMASSNLIQPDQGDTNHKSGFAIEISSIAISHENALAAAAALVSKLAHKLHCERVSLNFITNEQVRLYALSNSANYESKQNMIKRIETAMQEAVDQEETLAYPAARQSYHSLQAHRDLSEHHDSAFICSVPLLNDNEIIGGICFERSQNEAAFSKEEIELCEQLTTLVGPIIEYRRRNDQALAQKIYHDLADKVRAIGGENRLGGMLAFTLAAMLFTALIFVQWPYKVTANAVLEGAIERVITAPESGYIKQTTARAGDIIGAKQLLATLDDRDLQLEKLKWQGKKKQVNREYRQAFASYDRSKIGILRSQLDQAEAQLAILEKKLQRTQISTPIAGVIVSGDFTRSLGSPVEKGQVLFKVSPLDDYRIVLEVDESDISELRVGMKGELTLNASAEDSFTFVVEKITPVSRTANNANYFQIEAALEQTPEFLRPGMQGSGKINIGERQLLWVWTHKMVDWLRLQLWVLW